MLYAMLQERIIVIVIFMIALKCNDKNSTVLSNDEYQEIVISII